VIHRPVIISNTGITTILEKDVKRYAPITVINTLTAYNVHTNPGLGVVLHANPTNTIAVIASNINITYIIPIFLVEPEPDPVSLLFDSYASSLILIYYKGFKINLDLNNFDITIKIIYTYDIMSDQNKQETAQPGQAIVQVPVSVEKEQHFLNKTADVLGYKLPYWVLIVAGLLVLYYLYTKGVFNSLMGTQSVMITDKSVLRLPPTGVTDGIQTPEVVRKLLGMRV
jgi:hypothetical protein